jgi:hypothetical protein
MSRKTRTSRVTLSIRLILSCSQDFKSNFDGAGFFFSGSGDGAGGCGTGVDFLEGGGMIGADGLGEGLDKAGVEGAETGVDADELLALGFWSLARRLRRIWTSR